MELIFVFAIVLIQMFFINLFEVVQIIRAFRIHTFMDDEVFAVFLVNKAVIAMRTLQDGGFGITVILSGRKMRLADLTQNLAFLLAIIPHEIVHRGITCRAGTVFWNITLHSAKYRAYGFVVALLIISDEIFPVPVLLVGYDFRKLINLELLVLWRMGIIKSPLLEWDVSTDKVNKPVDLFMLVLNKLK